MAWDRSSIGIARLRVGVALALLAALGCGSDSEGKTPTAMPPVSVEVVAVTPRRLPLTLPAVGSLRSRETTTVAAEIEGVVTSLDVPEGQAVEAGHLLARLDDDEARAALSVARARYDNAKRRLARLQSLRQANASSEQALDDALSEYDSAAGQLQEVETRLRKTYIRTPFAGLLGLREASIGQYLSPGDPIVQITGIDPLELVFSVPEQHTAKIREGQTVLGMIGQCGQRFEARVVAIDPRVDAVTRMVRAQARVPNAEAALRPGMSVRLRLVVDEIPEAIVVPQAAIIRQGTRRLIYALDEEGLARQHQVELGQFFVDGVHVRSGLSPGESVVVTGHQKLRPGSRVDQRAYEPVRNENLELGWYGPGSECGH